MQEKGEKMKFNNRRPHFKQHQKYKIMNNKYITNYKTFLRTFSKDLNN